MHERNYPTHEFELAAMVFDMKIWTHYIYIVHVDVHINHKSIQYMLTQKEFNLKQRTWLDLFKDYDMSVLSHSSKNNVVADSLSKMTIGSVSHIDEEKKHLVKDVNWFCRVSARFDDSLNGGFMIHYNSRSSLLVKVKSKQQLDKPFVDSKESVPSKLNESFSSRRIVF